MACACRSPTVSTGAMDARGDLVAGRGHGSAAFIARADADESRAAFFSLRFIGQPFDQ